MFNKELERTRTRAFSKFEFHLGLFCLLSIIFSLVIIKLFVRRGPVFTLLYFGLVGLLFKFGSSSSGMLKEN